MKDGNTLELVAHTLVSAEYFDKDEQALIEGLSPYDALQVGVIMARLMLTQDAFELEDKLQEAEGERE